MPDPRPNATAPPSSIDTDHREASTNSEPPGTAALDGGSRDKTPGFDTGGSASQTPGLTLTRQAPAVAITAAADRPLTELWPALANTDAFQAALVDAVLAAANGHTADEFLDRLEDAEIDALRGAYRALLVRTAKGDLTGMCRLLLQTLQLGRGHSPLEDIYAAARVFALADAVTPTIAVRVPQAFCDLRAGQRRDICQLLAVLAEGCDLRVVAGPIEQRYLATEHRADLPGVSKHTITPLDGSTPEEERVTAALDALDIDGRPMRILEDLAAESTETLAYNALYALHSEVSKARVRQAIGTLVDLDVVATFEGPTGRMIELTPLGSAVLETVETGIGRQRRLPDRVSETGKSPSQYTCTTQDHGPPPTEGAGGTERGGFAESVYLSRVHTAMTAGVATEGDVVLVDRPLSRSADTREYGFWYENGADRLHLSVEYSAAHQWWVTLARALVERLDIPLSPARIDEAVLGEYPLAVLRDARNLGCLGADMDGEDYLEELREERDRVVELARKWREGDYEDGSAFYGELLRASKGLTYTVIHLLDLAGVDVVLEARLPEFVRHDAEERREFIETLTHGVAIQATYGEFSAYRQLFEDREDRREAAMSPRVDAEDPHGELVGTLVLSGPGVEGLEGDLREALADPDALHADAPEFDVPIRVGTPTRRAYAVAVREMCRAKNLDATREAVSVLQAFTGSPFDAARAINALSGEDLRREIRLSEVRYGLSRLPAGRVLPGEAPTVGAAVQALLEAEGPLTQGKLAEVAGVTARSIRNHTERLGAFDFIRETEGGYRLALPFNEEGERHEDVLPWYAHAEGTTLLDVLRAAESELSGEADYLEDPPAAYVALRWPPDRDALREAWPWVDRWIDRVEALLGIDPGSGPEPVTFGVEIEQASLVDRVTQGG